MMSMVKLLKENALVQAAKKLLVVKTEAPEMLQKLSRTGKKTLVDGLMNPKNVDSATNFRKMALDWVKTGKIGSQIDNVYR